MDIRNSLLPSLLVPAQTRPGRDSAATQQTITTVTPDQSRNTGSELAAYVSQGELLDGQRSGDYGDLIREARQQRVQGATRHDVQPGGQSTYVTHALSAYHANAAAAAGTATSGGFDETA